MNDEMIESRFLKTCDIPAEEREIEPFTMVIFGGAGDLSRRKLVPALFHLFEEKALVKDFSIVGFGRNELDDEGYRAMMLEAVTGLGGERLDGGKWNEFSRHLYFFSGPLEEEEAYGRLCEKIDLISTPEQEGKRNVIYYMAVPPHITPVAVERLKGLDLCRGRYSTKIIVEKPFGRDLFSAVDLNKILTDAFREDQIYRIDHYLGKDPVQNILFFRFSNAIFEQIWNCRYVDNIQITVAEDIGIEHRGGFYEQTGVVRDIVQNHIMQLIGLVGMEPPVGVKADYIRDEIVKVLRSVRPIDYGAIDKFAVRGQYGPGKIGGKTVVGYREEQKVPAASYAPTFFAGKFYIDNLRWAKVPFYVRTGKRMKKRITEICIQFKNLPLRLFGRTCDILEPNILSVTIEPDERISLRFGVKYPYAANKIHSANMDFSYRDTFRVKRHPAYERLLIDCMKGDLTLFVRQDAVEAMWEVVDPIVTRWESVPPADFPNYAAGTWGPIASHLLLDQDGRCWITG